MGFINHLITGGPHIVGSYSFGWFGVDLLLMLFCNVTWAGIHFQSFQHPNPGDDVAMPTVPTLGHETDVQYHPVLNIWLVVWNLNFMTFHFFGGMSSSHLTKSMIFQRGRSTTNQTWSEIPVLLKKSARASRFSWITRPTHHNPLLDCTLNRFNMNPKNPQTVKLEDEFPHLDVAQTVGYFSHFFAYN